MKNLDLRTITNYYSQKDGKTIGKYREYSVLMPFVEHEKEVNLLLELRASNMEDAPGEICFPGGRVEVGETPEIAALRECEEELGISQSDIVIIGPTDRLYTFSGAVIYIVPGVIQYDSLKNTVYSKAEVEEAFLAPLSFFVENEPYVHTGRLIPDRSGFPYEMAGIDENYPWDTGKSEVPVYNPLPDGKIVWGLTANIIRHFVEDIKLHE